MDTKEAISVNVIPWRWTKTRELAARHIAADRLTTVEIADILGMTDRQIFRWKKHPEFITRVEKYRKQYGDFGERVAIGHKLRRLETLNTVSEKIKSIIDARAGDPDCQRAPGGNTGLLARELKMLGSGPGQHLVEQFEFDAPLVKELRETMKQAAMELNQWPKGGTSLNINNVNQNNVQQNTIVVSPDPEIARLECEIATRFAAIDAPEGGATESVGVAEILQPSGDDSASPGGAESATPARGDDA